jgi:hypothetical protein
VGGIALVAQVGEWWVIDKTWEWLLVTVGGLLVISIALFHQLRFQREAARFLPETVEEKEWVRQCLGEWETIKNHDDEAAYANWEGGLNGAGGVLDELANAFADDIERQLKGRFGKYWATQFRDVAHAVPLGRRKPGIKAESNFPHRLEQAQVLLDRFIVSLSRYSI